VLLFEFGLIETYERDGARTEQFVVSLKEIDIVSKPKMDPETRRRMQISVTWQPIL
jgi:hypothetical protein